MFFSNWVKTRPIAGLRLWRHKVINNSPDHSTKPLLAQLKLLEAQNQVNKINIRQQQQQSTAYNFYSEILNHNFTPKMGIFDFFQTNKNYSETFLLIDEEYISQEASYPAQQSPRKVKSPKLCVKCLKFVFN